MSALRGVTLLALVVLAAPLWAGCAGPGDDGRGNHDRRYVNPYAFDLHFDGWRAYEDTLAQIYDDPEARSGPRYRIPGTPTHEAVATELHERLDEALRPAGGGASFLRFGGDLYYDLDLTVVSPYLCSADHDARERVRGLQFTNIIGRTSNTEIGVIVAAHWDSKREADASHSTGRGPVLGADDGAAASAAVIELARAFAREDPGVAMTFALFDGEDGFAATDCHPLAGSLYYAQSLTPQEKETVKGVIVLDMVGNASARFYHEGYSNRFNAPAGTVRSDWLGDALWATAAAMEVEAFVDRNTSPIADDHVPFLYEGLYAVDIVRYEDGFAEYWHTTRDDHTAVQPEGIDQVGAVVEATIRRLSASDAWGPA